MHQPYVDGGLFSMSLIYAIHAVGLGCIPLSCGFYKSKLDQIKKEYDVPNNEIPIILLGVGYLKDSFKIAISTRKAIVNTNKYHY